MPKAYASAVIDKPAAVVWAAIRDFNTLPVWNPGLVTRSEIEGGKACDQVGAVRSFYLTDGAHLREGLVAHSDKERSYSYDFQTSPLEVLNYHATMRVTPVTDGDRSFVEWWSSYDCDTAKIDEWQAFFGQTVFQGGLASLKQHVGG